jgi:imidazole glycerol-phosphate synthase subunit HisH
MIAVVDYGLGNLRSVQKAFEYKGFECTVTGDLKILKNAAGLVLPGVGAFSAAMGNLSQKGLCGYIEEWIAGNRPFLGICLGFQMLFEHSEEGNVKGLGLFKGTVRRFPADPFLKVPQIGWNSIDIVAEHPMLDGIRNGAHVYFVHSYYVDANDRKDVVARTGYGVEFDSAAARGNVFATQFHPEKSGEVGLRIIKNFGTLVYKGKCR